MSNFHVRYKNENTDYDSEPLPSRYFTQDEADAAVQGLRDAVHVGLIIDGVTFRVEPVNTGTGDEPRDQADSGLLDGIDEAS